LLQRQPPASTSSSTAAASSSKKSAKKAAKSAKRVAKGAQQLPPSFTQLMLRDFPDALIGWVDVALTFAERHCLIGSALLLEWKLLDWLEVGSTRVCKACEFTVTP
jgi:hypothetical protein